MTQLIKVRAGAVDFWIEPDEKAVTGRRPAKVSGEKKFPLEEIKELPFEVVSDIVSTVCTALTDSLRNLPKEKRPSKVTTEFGLTVTGEGNVYVVKTTGEASLTITAEWDMS